MLFLLIKVCLISNNGGVFGIAMTTAIVPEVLIPGEGGNLVKTKVTEQTLTLETEPVTEILAEERNLAQNIQLDEERLQNHHE